MARKQTKAQTILSTELSFEDALGELQQIVNELEDGSLGLEESLRRFEVGMGLMKTCHQILTRAEQKIEILTGFKADGTPVTAPFDATATHEEHRPAAGKRRSTTNKKPSPPTLTSNPSDDATGKEAGESDEVDPLAEASSTNIVITSETANNKAAHDVANQIGTNSVQSSNGSPPHASAVEQPPFDVDDSSAAIGSTASSDSNTSGDSEILEKSSSRPDGNAGTPASMSNRSPSDNQTKSELRESVTEIVAETVVKQTIAIIDVSPPHSSAGTNSPQLGQRPRGDELEGGFGNRLF